MTMPACQNLQVLQVLKAADDADQAAGDAGELGEEVLSKSGVTMQGSAHCEVEALLLECYNFR